MSETTVRMLVEMGFRDQIIDLPYVVVRSSERLPFEPEDIWRNPTPIVIPYPELQKDKNGDELEEILTTDFQREIDDRLEQIEKIKLCKLIALTMTDIEQPFRNITKRSSWSHDGISTTKHTYYNVFYGWGNELRIHVRFCDFDSDEQKDAVVENVLSGFHKKFGCKWAREMSKNDSRFKTKVRIGESVVDVVMQMDDSLGCWIEEVVSKREANKYETENVVIKDGMVLKPCNDLEVGPDGTLVKITKNFKSYCDGEAR